MDKMEVIFVRADDDDHIVRAEDGTIASAALQLLKERVEQGWWYDYPENAQANAEAIVASGDGNAAWRFLFNRRDYEYEWVETRLI